MEPRLSCPAERCSRRAQNQEIGPRRVAGRETCNQHFGGVFVCANGDCDQSKERDMLDTEGYGYLV